MKKEFFNTILDAVEQDYNGDVELLLSDIRKSIEENRQDSGVKDLKLESQVLLQIKNVSKEYQVGKETIHALREVKLDIFEGEILALVGPSGSGKSSLLNMIGGLDTPTTGDILVGNSALNKLKDKELSIYRNQTIGFIFQFFNLQPYLNVRENVEVPLIFRGEDYSKRNAASLDAVESVGLKDRLEHLPNQLSGGQMQRVAIARAIVNKPRIILADEPTGNLDRNTGIEIIELIRKLNRELNTTVVIVTHDNFIANKADRIIRMADGRII
jgi:putative ABC transport system ATP-binding protein